MYLIVSSQGELLAADKNFLDYYNFSSFSSVKDLNNSLISNQNVNETFIFQNDSFKTESYPILMKEDKEAFLVYLEKTNSNDSSFSEFELDMSEYLKADESFEEDALLENEEDLEEKKEEDFSQEIENVDNQFDFDNTLSLEVPLEEEKFEVEVNDNMLSFDVPEETIRKNIEEENPVNELTDENTFSLENSDLLLEDTQNHSIPKEEINEEKKEFDFGLADSFLEAETEETTENLSENIQQEETSHKETDFSLDISLDTPIQESFEEEQKEAKTEEYSLEEELQIPPSDEKKNESFSNLSEEKNEEESEENLSLILDREEKKPLDIISLTDSNTKKEPETFQIEVDFSTITDTIKEQTPILDSPINENEIEESIKLEKDESKELHISSEIQSFLNLSTTQLEKQIEEDLQKASIDLGVDTEIMKQFFEDFISQVKDEKENLYTYLNEKDFDEIHKCSHKLKGVALNLRLKNFGELFEELDRLAQSKTDISELRFVVKNVYTLLNELKKDIHSDLSDNSSTPIAQEEIIVKKHDYDNDLENVVILTPYEEETRMMLEAFISVLEFFIDELKSNNQSSIKTIAYEFNIAAEEIEIKNLPSQKQIEAMNPSELSNYITKLINHIKKEMR